MTNIQKLILVTVFAFLNATICMAAVTGTVTDTNGNPLAGAFVTFTGESSPYWQDYVLTNEVGYYTIEIPPQITVIEDAPVAFSLGQNYPNPFNPTTTIPFTLEAPDRVTVTIYNVMGQRIATVIDTYMGAGGHSITWDGMDDRGNHVSAGIYFYRLQAGQQILTKKMLLLDGGSGAGGGAPPASQTALDADRSLAKTSDHDTYTITIVHRNCIPYEEPGVVLSDGDVFDCTMELTEFQIPEDITFVAIPAVTEPYVMNPDAGSTFSVTLSAYEMSVTEITNAQYVSFLNAALASEDITATDSMVTGPTFVWGDQVYIYLKDEDNSALQISYTDGAFTVDAGMGNRPVVGVTWYGATVFAQYYGFYLPTECEWQYAASGGRNNEYGTIDGTLDGTKANTTNGLVDTGCYLANPFGLYDMTGNAAEWCGDELDTYPYGTYDNYDGGILSSNRVVRGTAYTVPSRSSKLPDETMSSLGFRVVKRSGPTVSGKVLGFSTLFYKAVVVTMNGEAKNIKWGGYYYFKDVHDGTYTISFEMISHIFTPPTIEVTVNGSDVVARDVTMREYSYYVVEPGGIDMGPFLCGDFTMGDTSGDGESDELPVHDVYISALEISTHEITQEQYTAVTGENPSAFSGEHMPVGNVSWYDAVRFCNELSRLTDLEPCYDEDTWECDFDASGYRLPTEAEWERASGGVVSDLATVGWYSGNSDSQPHPVGQKGYTGWGLYDMHGNIAEWCNDWYGPYSSESQTNPAGASTGTTRVVRGGSYLDDAENCRSTARSGVTPGDKTISIGFRIVRR